MKDCIFCKLSLKEIPVKRIYENENFFSILDQNQEISGHALVISKKHFETCLDLPLEIGEDLLDCISKTASTIMEDFGASGFNVLNNNFESAGQEVKHVHFHIFPRKENDGARIFE